MAGITSLQKHATEVEYHGRGEDDQLVHMSRKELQSLQALAKLYGGSLTINPRTGLPEAGFLSRILPMAVAAAAIYFGGPAGAAAVEGAGAAGAAGAAGTGLFGGMSASGIGALAGGAAGAFLNKKDPLMGGIAGALGGYGLGQAGWITPQAEAAALAADPVALTAAQTDALVRAGTITPPGMISSGAGEYGSLQPALTQAFNLPVVPPTETINPWGAGEYGNSSAVPPVTSSVASPVASPVTPPVTPSVPLSGGKETSPKFSTKLIDFINTHPYLSAGAALTLYSSLNDSNKNYRPPGNPLTTYQDFNFQQGQMTGRGPLGQAYYSNPTFTRRVAKGGILGLSRGGNAQLPSRMIKGPGTGLSDSIPARIDGQRPAALANGEFVVSSDVVSALGGGATDSGAKKLYAMMDRVRKQAHGTKKQIRKVSDRTLPV